MRERYEKRAKEILLTMRSERCGEINREREIEIYHFWIEI